MANYKYTERSWGLDLASEGNQACRQRKGRIGHIGGEWGVSRTGSTSLFPDLILFSDDNFGQILQGWELKLPDTPIEDHELIQNAVEKADRLGTSSFVLWNVRHAVLWVRSDSGFFERYRHWDELDDIDSRDKVLPGRMRWLKLLDKILLEIEDLLTDGKIRPAKLSGALGSRGIFEAVLAHSGSVANEIRGLASRDQKVYDEVTRWWLWNKSEYSGEHSDLWTPLAKIVISKWLNKILFSHVLQNTFDIARTIKTIDESKTINDGIDIISAISDKIDFKNILNTHLGEDALSEDAWKSIVDLNGYLSEFRFDNIDSSNIHEILNAAIETSKRKSAGQYATPAVLASLLVQIGLPTPNSVVIDPCCGTGTIGRSALELKRASGIPAAEVVDQVWASDKFSYPIQLAHLAMVDPQSMGSMVRVFRSDIFDLEAGEPVTLIDPSTGSDIQVNLPEFDAVISNFPFVRSEDLKIANAGASNQISALHPSIAIDRGSDLYAYLPFHCWKFLRTGGRLAFITSNSWMATSWGKTFRDSVRRLYKLKTVVISSAGRWFQNVEVVTTIIILEKLDSIQELANQPSYTTDFISINTNLAKISDRSELSNLANLIRVPGVVHSDEITVNAVNTDDLIFLDDLGLSWMVNFLPWKWLRAVDASLIKANTIMNITRGARRGWDKMFYPSDFNKIEPEFILPVLMNTRSVKTFDVTVSGKAFSCELSKKELLAAGKHGALEWIGRFENGKNGKGIPLPTVLRLAAREADSWYQFPATNTARIITSMNPGNRLFFGLLERDSFVNQRLIALSPKDGVDAELCAALLNTSLSLFFVEGLGFGRGAGALDLSSTRLSSGLHMLNPAVLSELQIQDILTAFAPMRKREVLDIVAEMSSQDRIDFEEVVYGHFGLLQYASEIRTVVKDLVSRRLSANIDEVEIQADEKISL